MFITNESKIKKNKEIEESELPPLIKEEDYKSLAISLTEMKVDQAKEAVESWIAKFSQGSTVDQIVGVLIQVVQDQIHYYDQECLEYEALSRGGVKAHCYDDDGEYNYEFDYDEFYINEGAAAAISQQLDLLKKTLKKLESLMSSQKVSVALCAAAQPGMHR